MNRVESKEGKNRREVIVDRYEHDMKLANAMRLRKSANAGDGRTTRKEDKTTAADDVLLGMNGLDEADRLRDRGELESALKLYELGLELLIRVLGSVETDGIDRGTLQARVQVGLSSAEDTKARLKASPSQRPFESSGERSPRQSTFRSLSNAISSALNSPPKQKSNFRPPVTRPSSARHVPQAAPSSSPTADASTEIRQHVLSDLYVPPADLQKTTWDDIAGLDGVKQALQEAAIFPLMRPDLFTGLRRPQNVLLFGPPGTGGKGKTMLARAVAHESGCNLFVCSASSMTSKWMGEAEKIVKHLFQIAREFSPSIVFIDEMDSLLSSRKSDGEHEASRRLKTEFMVQMDGISKHGNDDQQVLVLGCTNCPWDVDSAVLRRLPRRLLVPLPDADARLGLFAHLLKKAGKHSISARQLKELAQRTEGFSCSDIAAIASEASFGPLRSIGGMQAIRSIREKDVRPINIADFEHAISQATKSVGPDQLRRYKEWQDQQSAS